MTKITIESTFRKQPQEFTFCDPVYGPVPPSVLSTVM